MGDKLFIGNLSQRTREAELRAGFLAQDIAVTEITMVNDPDTGRPRGFAFVELAEGEVSRAIECMDGYEIQGRAITVRRAQRARAGRASASSSPARTQVLVVEDDRDLREVARGALFAAGYGVAAVANGREALEFLRGGCQPAVILLDLTMAIMDGPAFVAELRKLPIVATVKLVLVSGSEDVDKHAAALGAQAVLRKPFGIDELTAAVVSCRA